MKYVLGIDFGGGASKATLLDENGEVAATETIEYPTRYPSVGRAEQNPSDWYDATCRDIAGILKKTGVNPRDIAALSLDAATHTAVLTDGDFNVLRPAIYWTDTRCISEVNELEDAYGDIIRSISLHSVSTIWTLPQLLWVKKNEPDLFLRIKHIMFAKDYVRHRITGDNVTDNIEAEGSMLFDCTEQKWSKELCDICGIDISVLPEIVAPSDIVGTVSAEAAAQTGLAVGTKVLCGTTDTAMEVYATGAYQPGDMTLKLATAGRICVLTGNAVPDKNLINYSYVMPGLWYPGTGTKSCASSYRWFRDTFGGEYAELDAEAANLPCGTEGLIFHPYLNGEMTPYQDPFLCGSFTGIRSNHTKAHFARAVMEGVSFSMLDCLAYLDSLNIERKSFATVIGGGGKSPLWRQICSDTLDLELSVRRYSDSSYGSAMLAARALGILSDKVSNPEISRTVPNEEKHIIYTGIFAKYKRIHDVLADIYRQ